MGRAAASMQGQVFGHVTVLEHLGSLGKSSLWRCRCDNCGNVFESTRSNIVRSRTGSCGCLVPKSIGDAHRKHGGSESPEYEAWAAMIQRCMNPNNARYRDYGERGIRVYGEWQSSFEAFVRDVGPRPPGLTGNGHAEYSLDRIDNSKGYEPGNVRWATAKQQANNRRNSC